MTRPRIALTQRVEDLPDRDERRDALDQRWAGLCEALGAAPVPVPNSLADPGAVLADLDVSLLVLTGGNDLSHLPKAAGSAPERDRTELALLDAAESAGLPVLGVCRGLQLMVHRAGGRLVPVEGHVAATHTISVADRCDWPLADGREVNSYHDWGVAAEGVGGLEVLATAPDGTVEAVEHPRLVQVGVMWHPERDPEHPADLALIRALLERSP